MFREKNGIKLYFQEHKKDRQGARREERNVDIY
jgi:hypothetical protein